MPTAISQILGAILNAVPKSNPLFPASQQTNWDISPEALAATRSAQIHDELMRQWPAYWDLYNRKAQDENAMRQQMWQQLFWQAQQFNRPYFLPAGEPYYPQVPRFPYAQQFQAPPMYPSPGEFVPQSRAYPPQQPYPAAGPYPAAPQYPARRTR